MRQFILLLCILLSSFSSIAVNICAHRGVRGLLPENTLNGFKKALHYQIQCIDMDVVITRDGIPVVYHDLYLNPQTTQDKQGQWVKSHHHPVKQLSFKQLHHYNIGRVNPNTDYAHKLSHQRSLRVARIPSLEDALRLILKHEHYPLQLQIELKTDPRDPASPNYRQLTLAVAKIIHRHHLDTRTKIQAFDWRCLSLLKKTYPKIQRAYLTEDMPSADLNSGVWTDRKLLKNYHHSIPYMIQQLGGTYWDAEDLQLTPKTIQEAHALGLKVCAWTDIEKYHPKHLIKQLLQKNIDCLITDRPDLFSSVSTYNNEDSRNPGIVFDKRPVPS